MGRVGEYGEMLIGLAFGSYPSWMTVLPTSTSLVWVSLNNVLRVDFLLPVMCAERCDSCPRSCLSGFSFPTKLIVVQNLTRDDPKGTAD